jgi:transposase, IS5 family
MTIALQGLDSKLKSTSMTVFVSPRHSLIRLANALNWKELANLALFDLKSTTKQGFWWLGRRLYIRVHLGIYVLQCLLKETDRGVESRINDTPVCQVFCGRTIVSKWKCPDHTKIEEFRNRLSPETQQKIGAVVVKTAQELGFADPSWMDVDSTVQEANISYPSDAGLMKKLSEKAYKVLEYLKAKKKQYLPAELNIDIQKIRKKSLGYFFLAQNASIELRREVFASYHGLVQKQLKSVIEFYDSVNPSQLKHLPWNIRRHLEQIREKGKKYLADVGYFVRNHTVKPGKILSLHADAAACISKKKAGKPNEFGRVIQLGRIGGNFLIAFTSTSIRMEDKPSLLPVIEEHRKIFGADVLKEVGTDKGYYSEKNVRAMKENSINSDGIQRPVNIKTQLSFEVVKPLRDRRAGIEPLIGHAKAYGLQKSKMKSDRATLASGYRSVLGFNLSQLTRYLKAG